MECGMPLQLWACSSALRLSLELHPHTAGTPRLPAGRQMRIQIGLFGHPAWRTTFASGFDCADPTALSIAGPGPRR